MAQADENLGLKTIIERAETPDDFQLRSKKTQVFRWQARTAAVCLVARFSLLYYYTKFMIEAQRAKSLPWLGFANVAAFTFLIVETSFTRKSGLLVIKDKSDLVPVYRLYPQHLQSMQFGPKARFRPKLRILGDNVPTVDVLIFYCGEDVSKIYTWRHEW